ncbi:hypothetical protein FPQ18DRAFT_397353 [Pyronema domesticum]|nr:hypothetical protein FPQ18DRAFT_397353 [Pyronema domesticum]
MSNPSSCLSVPAVGAPPSASLPASSSVAPFSSPVHVSSAVLAEAPAAAPSTSSVFVLSPAPLPTQMRTLQLAGLPTDGTVIFDRLSMAELAAACHKMRNEKKRQADRQAKAAAVRAASAAAASDATVSAADISGSAASAAVAVVPSVTPALPATPKKLENDDVMKMLSSPIRASLLSRSHPCAKAEGIPKVNQNL